MLGALCNQQLTRRQTPNLFITQYSLLKLKYTVFSHDVMAAILVSQNNETAAMLSAMLVSQTIPVGVELFSYVNALFCSNKFAYMLATWVKTLYSLSINRGLFCMSMRDR